MNRLAEKCRKLYWILNTLNIIVVIEGLHQYFKYYQSVVFSVKVLFLAPVVEICICHTCLLVSRGCCCGLSAAVTIVLNDLTGSEFCSTYCHTLSTRLMYSIKFDCLTTQFSVDIFNSLKNRFTIRTACLDQCSSWVAMINWYLSPHVRSKLMTLNKVFLTEGIQILQNKWVV